MPTSRPCPPRHQFHSNAIPSSPPAYFDRGVSTDPIHPDERVEFQSQQTQRRQQRFQSQSRVQHAGREVWDLEDQLDKWVGKCAFCYVRRVVDIGVDFRHTLDECPEQEQEQALVVGEVKVLNGIRSLPPARRVPRGADFTATTHSIPGIRELLRMRSSPADMHTVGKRFEMGHGSSSGLMAGFASTVGL